MKNYLKDTLSEEEKNLIRAIIYITAKNYKKQIYKKTMYKFMPIHEIDIAVEDEYLVIEFEYKTNKKNLTSCTNEEKSQIAKYIDNVLIELDLDKFKIALTFEEKLVLFLYYFQKHTEENVAILLNISRRTVSNKKKSIEMKKNKFLGGNKNV